MRVTVVALLVGLAAGLVALARGGRSRLLPVHPVRWPALLVVALLAYWVPAWIEASGAFALAPALAAYAGLVVFAAANVRMRGMAIVLIGLLCNAAVLTVNGAIPVDEEAVVAAGMARAEEVERIDLAAPREWRAPEHRLVLLTDIIPVAPLREVVSFGDLILAAGLANVVFRALPPLVGPPHPSPPSRRRRRRRRRRSGAPASGGEDPGAEEPAADEPEGSDDPPGEPEEMKAPAERGAGPGKAELGAPEPKAVAPEAEPEQPPAEEPDGPAR